MSYAVNWVAKVISIPTSDLTLVSGDHYSLDMADFLAEVRRLEWDFSEGLWAPAIIFHTDTRFDFAGANYAPFDAFLNGYQVQITGTATRVDLLGSNNDFIDNLIVSGVSIVPSNSAGLQIVSGGAAQDDITHVRKLLENKAVIAGDDSTSTIYDDDKVTPLVVFDHPDTRTRDPQ